MGHQKAHGDKVAVETEFYDVISSDSKVSNNLKAECLERGNYQRFIDIWESHKDGEIIIVDGEEFRENPGLVLNNFVGQVRNINEVGITNGNSEFHNINFTDILEFGVGKSMYCISKKFAKEY